MSVEQVAFGDKQEVGNVLLNNTSEEPVFQDQTAPRVSRTLSSRTRTLSVLPPLLLALVGFGLALHILKIKSPSLSHPPPACIGREVAVHSTGASSSVDSVSREPPPSSCLECNQEPSQSEQLKDADAEKESSWSPSCCEGLHSEEVGEEGPRADTPLTLDECTGDEAPVYSSLSSSSSEILQRFSSDGKASWIGPSNAENSESEGRDFEQIEEPVAQELWNLPTLEQFEESLSAVERRGKSTVAKLARYNDYHPRNPSTVAEDVLRCVAHFSTPENADSPTGQMITLTNISEYGTDELLQEQPSTFRVLRVLGKGAFKLVVEVQDLETNNLYALAILVGVRHENDDVNKLLDWFRIMQECEETPSRDMGIPSTEAADVKGWCFPLYKATLAGVPQIVAGSDSYVFSEVLLMERLHGNLREPLSQLSVDTAARRYICRRLLLIVLHLQEARISHNDIKLDNLLLRPDGSFLLADFGTSTPFEKPMRNFGITEHYAAPELFLAVHNYWYPGHEVRPTPQSDLWSLGLALYFIFTDGELPYGLNAVPNARSRAFRSLVEDLLSSKKFPDTLRPEMEKHEVPKRWQDLICNLLEPRDADRISARDIVREFRDLIGMPEEERKGEA